jgi:hypothetical protein
MRLPARGSSRARAARAIARHADHILKEAAAKERDLARQGLRTVTLSREQLIRKLSEKTAHSPFLTQIGWGNAVRGSTFYLTFGIMNPDPYPYDEGNLSLCVYWGAGTGVGSPGEALLAADRALGVIAVELGILNASATPHYISAAHVLPATLATGAVRSDLSYLMYTINAFGPIVVLERGTLSIAIA